MLLAPVYLLVRVVRRFHAERCAQTAAALAFTSLLGLVPMVAVGVLLLEFMPFGIKLAATLEKFLLATLLPDKAGVVIARYLSQFVQHTEQFTWFGLGLLGLTALVQMFTIEQAFNAIWKVRMRRAWWRRIGLHLLTLMAGPLLFGAALFSVTFLASFSFGLIDEPRWVRVAFAELMSPIFLAALLSLLYWALPNRPVVPWHAIFSGILVASIFVGMQRLFALYIVQLPTYSLLYGAFSVLPIFLLWLYVSWAIVLLGALLTAELPSVAKR
jgi:membrane protein